MFVPLLKLFSGSLRNFAHRLSRVSQVHFAALRCFSVHIRFILIESFRLVAAVWVYIFLPLPFRVGPLNTRIA